MCFLGKVGYDVEDLRQGRLQLLPEPAPSEPAGRERVTSTHSSKSVVPRVRLDDCHADPRRRASTATTIARVCGFPPNPVPLTTRQSW